MIYGSDHLRCGVLCAAVRVQIEILMIGMFSGSMVAVTDTWRASFDGMGSDSVGSVSSTRRTYPCTLSNTSSTSC